MTVFAKVGHDPRYLAALGRQAGSPEEAGMWLLEEIKGVEALTDSEREMEYEDLTARVRAAMTDSSQKGA